MPQRLIAPGASATLRAPVPGREASMAEWNVNPVWFVLGMAGQAIFFSRFLVQWVASERARKSFIPPVFWWLSLVGSMLLLAYAIHRKDPVFVLGQAFGWVVYARNLMLIQRNGDPAAG
jgi:lipid-A-disaccharide synthase-like uncharacterized protein